MDDVRCKREEGLIALEDVAGIDLLNYIVQDGFVAVGDDSLALCLELLIDGRCKMEDVRCSHADHRFILHLVSYICASEPLPVLRNLYGLKRTVYRQGSHYGEEALSSRGIHGLPSEL